MKKFVLFSAILLGSISLVSAQTGKKTKKIIKTSLQQSAQQSDSKKVQNALIIEQKKATEANRNNPSPNKIVAQKGI